ncbi:MAG: holo-ACP synthase [Acidimicrobiales bacterium]
MSPNPVVPAGGRLAVGVDLVEVGRFRDLLARRPGVATRLFVPEELAYAARFGDPAPHLAARFAAKEAFIKLLGAGLGAVSWHEVHVERAPTGQPLLSVSGRAAELASERGLSSWSLSLTHTSLIAAAVVAGMGDGGQ